MSIIKYVTCANHIQEILETQLFFLYFSNLKIKLLLHLGVVNACNILNYLLILSLF